MLGCERFFLPILSDHDSGAGISMPLGYCCGERYECAGWIDGGQGDDRSWVIAWSE